MFTFVVLAVIFVLVLIIAATRLYPGSRKEATLPGLSPSDPRDGNFVDIKHAGSLHKFLMDLHAEFPEIASFWMGTQLIVSIASPRLFAEHRKVSDRPSVIFEQFTPLITKESIQFANGGDARWRRNLYDCCYNHEAIASYYVILQKVVDDLVVKLSSVTTDEHIPLQQYMFDLTIKSIVRVSFGDYFNDDDKVLEFQKNYNLGWSEMERRILGDIDPDKDSPRQKRFERAMQAIRETLKEVIAQRKQISQSEKDKKLIDVIMESGASEERILADTITYLVAGFHSTGYMMTWCLYYLATNPRIQDKVCAELNDVLGEGKVTADSAKQLIYTRQVIDETIRCSLIVTLAARFQDRDSELGGYIIPKNTPVFHSLGVVFKDKDLYPDPDRFDPDRFSQENKKTRPNLSFEPFGFAGRRKCPAYRLAYAEGAVFLATLLRKFEFKLVEGQVVTPVLKIITVPADEIWITVTQRQ